MQSKRTWALIADGSRARIVENNGYRHGWANVDGMIFSSGHSATFDLVSGAQQTADVISGWHLSTNAAHSDPYTDIKSRFAHQLCDVLADALERDAYQHLIIAAPKVMLLILQKSLSLKVKVRIIGEFADDLTKMPLLELGLHLQPVVIN